MRMKRTYLVLMMMGALAMSSINVMAADDIPLSVGYVDPTKNQDKPHKSPLLVPEMTIDGYELTFITPCLGDELLIIDNNGNIVFSTVITSNTLILPTNFSGDYEIQIVCENVFFYGYIEL